MRVADTQRNDVLVLRPLVELEYDLVDAYSATAAATEDASVRRRLLAFAQTHRRHAQELDSVVCARRGERVTYGSAVRVLTRGHSAIRTLGSDRARFAAMRSNEAQAMTLVDAAARCTSELRPMLETVLADMRRHHEWFERALGAGRPSVERVSSPSLF